MNALKADELLRAWEQGLGQPVLQRALILLAAATPEEAPDSLMQLSVGQRDHRLLLLRAQLFGQRLLNTSACPKCGERIEWENKIMDFILPLEKETLPAQEFDLNTDDYLLRFRLPNSLDIAATQHCIDQQHAQQLLLSRCLLESKHKNEKCPANQLPDKVIQTLGQEIEKQDPHAEISLQLHCPECSHRWNSLFDIGSFLCSEVNDWAEKMLHSVYRLAAGYGWSERDILELSPVRRQLYLGMLSE